MLSFAEFGLSYTLQTSQICLVSYLTQCYKYYINTLFVEGVDSQVEGRRVKADLHGTTLSHTTSLRTAGLRHELFFVNQTHNSVTIVVQVLSHVLGLS